MLTAPDAAQAYLKEKFSFPDYYGNNLDALFDCLCEIGDKTRIIFHSLSALRSPSGQYARSVLSVLCDAAIENGALTVCLCSENAPQTI